MLSLFQQPRARPVVHKLPCAVQPWHILDGPATFQHPRGGDWDIGWAWLIQREDERRHVVVYVAGGHLKSTDLAEESHQAIETSGRSAVYLVLRDDEPPERLIVTTDGILRG